MTRKHQQLEGHEQRLDAQQDGVDKDHGIDRMQDEAAERAGLRGCDGVIVVGICVRKATAARRDQSRALPRLGAAVGPRDDVQSTR